MGATFASSINLQMLLLTQNIMIMARREGFHFFVAAAQRKKAPPWFNGADNYPPKFYNVTLGIFFVFLIYEIATCLRKLSDILQSENVNPVHC